MSLASPVRVELHDSGPDRLGRRHFSLHWYEDWKDRFSPSDPDMPAWLRSTVEVVGGKPLFRRAQHFFAVPGDYGIACPSGTTRSPENWAGRVGVEAVPCGTC